MCFSAEASFGASAVIGVISALSIKKANSPPQYAFAMVPLFFAIQQGIEGLVWLSLTELEYASWTNAATHAFLVFAWLVWPSYIPFMMRWLEKNEKRKKVLTIFLMMGVCTSLLLAYGLFFHPVRAEVQGLYIKYLMSYDFRYQGLVGVLYFIPIVFSFYISTTGRMWVIGTLILATFVATALFYRDHLISVWCFFAALTSITILWGLESIQRHRHRSQDANLKVVR